MTVISLSIRSYYLLSAALEFAPKDSVKCFLNAVHIAPQGGAAHVVATDASALFIGRAEAAPSVVDTAGALQPFEPVTIHRAPLAAALKAVKPAVKNADTLEIEIDEDRRSGRLRVFNFGLDRTGSSAFSAPISLVDTKYVDYRRIIPTYTDPAAPIPVVSCKYLTAVTKAAAALRPARERADLSAEIVNQMQAVFALADDAAAIVMGIRLDDRRRPSYERTAAAIMAD